VLLIGLLVRAWPWLSEPLMPWEDGALFFAQNYAEFEWVAAIHPYAGYVPVGSNLQSLLVCRAPTTWIPSAFVLSAALMLLGAAATLLRPAWQKVAPFGTRLLMAVAIAWVPFGSNLEFTSLAYSQWPQLLWLFLLLVEPADDRTRGWLAAVSRFALVACLTVCNPVGLVLLPLGLWLMRQRAKRLDGAAYLVAMGVFVGIILCCRNQDLVPEIAGLWRDLLPAMARPVFVESFFGLDGWRALRSVGSAAEWGAALGVLVGFVALVGRAFRSWSREVRFFAIAATGFALATVAVSLVCRPGWMAAEQHVVRYAWPARAVVWLLTCLALATLWRPRLAAVVVALLAAGVTVGNADLHRHPRGDWGVGAFMLELKEQEEELGGRRWIRTRWQPEKGPMIVIRPH